MSVAREAGRQPDTQMRFKYTSCALPEVRPSPIPPVCRGSGNWDVPQVPSRPLQNPCSDLLSLACVST